MVLNCDDLILGRSFTAKAINDTLKVLVISL